MYKLRIFCFNSGLVGHRVSDRPYLGKKLHEEEEEEAIACERLRLRGPWLKE